jgi:hypothetical protein
VVHFRPKSQSIVINYHEICEFYAKKSRLLSGIVSLVPLFSYTSPEVPSFLTSLCVILALLDFCHDFLIHPVRKALPRLAVAGVARNGLRAESA